MYVPSPEGEAVQVLEPPAVSVEGEAEHERVLPSGKQDEPVQEFVTATCVHGPQLSSSFDSVIVPTHEASLSAHARAYQVPAVEKV